MILAFVFILAAADPPLETTKKNIVALKGVPTSQLIPIMATMANSLGVSCAYCHEAAWDSDAKPQKEIARRMIRMTRAINDTHYAGKVAVTCNTCHRGTTGTAVVPLVADAGWNQPPATSVQPELPPADELFARYVRAWGARESVRNRLSRGIVTARSGRADPRSAPFELYQELPNKVDLKHDVPHPPEANREIGSQFFNAAKIRERYASVRTIAVGTVRGRAAYVVEATPDERLYFDVATGVLLRRYRELPTLVGPLPEEFDFDDYRTVDGVLIPFVVQWSRADYQVTHRIAEVKQNVTR